MTTAQVSGKRWQRAQRAELRWWKKYLSRKDLSEYRKWKVAYWKSLLARLPDVLPAETGADVLDAGCGPAGIFMALSQYRVVAADSLLEQYDDLDVFVRDDYPWVEFRAHSIELPFGQRFRAAFCMNVLNHVLDLRSALNNMYEAVSESGYLIMTIDVHRTRLFRWLLSVSSFDRLHPHQYSLDDYSGMLADQGFAVMHSEPIWKRGPMAHWLLVAQKNSA